MWYWCCLVNTLASLGGTLQEVLWGPSLGTAPSIPWPSVYLTLPHMTRSPRPTSSVVTYCKQSKTGGGSVYRYLRSLDWESWFCHPLEKGWPGAWTDVWVSDSSFSAESQGQEWRQIWKPGLCRTDVCCSVIDGRVQLNVCLLIKDIWRKQE